MSHAIELLDKARGLCSPSTDYQLAKRLGIKQTTIIRCRKHGGTLDNKAAWKLAELLKMEPAEVIALMEEDRAKKPEDRRFWEQARASVAASIAVILGIFLLSAAPTPAQTEVPKNIYYVK